MVVNQKVTGRASSIPIGLAIGLGISLAMTLAFSMAIAYLQSNEMIPETGLGYAAMLTLLAASAAGAAAAYHQIKHQRLLVCLGAGGCYYLALLAVTALFFGGQYNGMGVTGLVILGGAGCVGLLGLRRRTGTSVRRRKIKNR